MPLPARIARWAPIVTPLAQWYGLDPFVVLAVLDRESNGCLTLHPPDPSGTGDNGHGRGAFQIDDRAHKGFVNATDDAGAPIWRDFAISAAYACRFLARLKVTFPISNLKGAETSRAPESRAYIAAYNTGAGNVRKSLAAGRDPDFTTTGGDYSADVMRRLTEFLEGQEYP